MVLAATSNKRMGKEAAVIPGIWAGIWRVYESKGLSALSYDPLVPGEPGSPLTLL
jgi:hypothetical protein